MGTPMLGRIGKNMVMSTHFQWDFTPWRTAGYPVTGTMSCGYSLIYTWMTSSCQGQNRILNRDGRYYRKAWLSSPKLALERWGVPYRGCTQRCFSIMIESGRKATVMSYDMEDCLDSCVATYCELAKITSPLRSYTTPILPDDHSRSAAGAPGEGPVTECPWCHHTATPTSFVTYPSVTALVKQTQGSAGGNRCRTAAG